MSREKMLIVVVFVLLLAVITMSSIILNLHDMLYTEREKCRRLEAENDFLRESLED